MVSPCANKMDFIWERIACTTSLFDELICIPCLYVQHPSIHFLILKVGSFVYLSMHVLNYISFFSVMIGSFGKTFCNVVSDNSLLNPAIMFLDVNCHGTCMIQLYSTFLYCPQRRTGTLRGKVSKARKFVSVLLCVKNIL